MDMKRKPKQSQLQSAVLDLEKALSDWEKLSVNPSYGLDDFTKKTRELLEKLNEQLKSFD